MFLAAPLIPSILASRTLHPFHGVLDSLDFPLNLRTFPWGLPLDGFHLKGVSVSIDFPLRVLVWLSISGILGLRMLSCLLSLIWLWFLNPQTLSVYYVSRQDSVHLRGVYSPRTFWNQHLFLFFPLLGNFNSIYSILILLFPYLLTFPISSSMKSWYFHTFKWKSLLGTSVFCSVNIAHTKIFLAFVSLRRWEHSPIVINALDLGVLESIAFTSNRGGEEGFDLRA